METLPRGNKWKLMTTGGAAKAQVLDSCPLHNNELISKKLQFSFYAAPSIQAARLA